MERLILASSSPRRKELLKLLGIPFAVIESNLEERLDEEAEPEKAIQKLAFQKAFHVAERYKDAYVIGADTAVILENRILGKPKDRRDAYYILKSLSGKTHTVLTAVSIIHGEKHTTFSESTKVTFWPLSDDEILEYIETNEPMDKAGAYGIQHFGSLLVKKIDGDYFTVVGLPVSRLYRELKNFGFHW
ncbi:Maf family protein [Aeribacillus pallidus]|nr:Maf family protein [Aeribacillus pallidus]